MTDSVRSDILHLVEDFSPTILNEEGLLLALTPEACFQLRKHGKPYVIWENYYSEKALLHFEKEYLQKLLVWFNQADDQLQRLIPVLAENNWRIVHELRFRLKYLIDSVTYVSYCVRHVLNSLAPKEIHYWKSSPCAAVSLDTLADNSRRFIEPCFRLFAEKKGIPFKNRLQFGLASVAPKAASKPRGIQRKIAKMFYFYFKYVKWNRPKKKTANVLFLSAGHKDSDPIIKDLIKRNARVFILSDGQIIDLNSFSNKSVYSLDKMDDDLHEKMQGAFKVASDQLLESFDFWNFLDQICEIKTESILRPYFQYFFEEVCPVVIGRIPKLKKILSQYKIDSLVARAATHNHEASFRLAATQVGTKRVCLQHGCQAIECEMVKLAHAEYFDYYFATDPESRAYAAQELITLNPDCQIREYSELLKPPMNKRKRSQQREKIIYLPTRGPVGVRILHNTKYPITWYFHLQLTILDKLAEIKDKDFYFKHAGISDWLDGSTLEYLRMKNYSNIKVISEPFSQCLEWVDRVIVDYPATSFYEAATSDVPLLALYHKNIPVREGAKKIFGKSLCMFENQNDLNKSIDDFLNLSGDRLKDYMPRLALRGENTASQLLMIRGGFHD